MRSSRIPGQVGAADGGVRCHQCRWPWSPTRRLRTRMSWAASRTCRFYFMLIRDRSRTNPRACTGANATTSRSCHV